MFRFVCKELLISSCSRNRASLTATTTTRPHFGFLQTQSLKSKSESLKDEKSLITVPYFVNSFGFSLESATKISKKIKIKSLEEADSVVELFRDQGFTDAQISDFITKRPSLLLAKPDKTFKPKLEFFKSLGMSTPELAKMISRCPSLLLRDLKNQIIPSCNFIKTFVHTDDKLVTVLKRYPDILLSNNAEGIMRPNISILRTYGVLDRNISSLMNNQLSALMLNSDRFEISILKAKKLGFNPKSGKFICAVRVMTNLSESNWEQKMEAYKSFGLSDEEFLSAFKLNPLFMESSEKKIRELMDFFVRKLEWKPSVVSKYPKILICSLEKNIIPRCSVLQILMSKGLVRKDLINIPSELVQSGMTFMNKFVIKYQGKVPEVVAAYQGKMRFEHFQSKDFTLNPKISPRQC